MKTTKKFWQSRILWLNAAFAALTAVEASLSLLQSAVGPHAYLIIAGIVAAGNMILRTLTTQGVSK